MPGPTAPDRWIPDRWIPDALFAAFALEFAALAWSPHDRSDWLLENLIVIPAVAWLFAARRRIAWSAPAWGLVFAFLALHEIGSHYTYSLVPWQRWCEQWLGWTPSVERNHYDRAVHLTFGLFGFQPLRELLPVASRPFWGRALAVCAIATLSTFYELLEWGAARTVDPELGIAFLGAQGDVWDAQKDMALAIGGAFAAALLSWLIPAFPAARSGRSSR